MPTLGNYCKAYPITRLREYGKWSEKPIQKPTVSAKAGAEEESEGGGPAEQYVFLQQNLIVTDGIFLDENVIFDSVTPEWEEFCKNQLEFQIPPEALPDSPA